MTKVYTGMPHLNGNILAAIDVEATGLRAGYHEIIQIAVAPLNEMLKPLDGVRPFYMNVKPLKPKRAEPLATLVHRLDLDELVKHALHPDRVEDLLIEWVEALELPHKKSLVPLAFNWAYENSMLQAWLGEPLVNKLFFAHVRDVMRYATSLNDKAFFLGEKVPFSNVNLKALCEHFGVVNQRPHDALCDALAEAEVYGHLLRMDVF